MFAILDGDLYPEIRRECALFFPFSCAQMSFFLCSEFVDFNISNMQTLDSVNPAKFPPVYLTKRLVFLTAMKTKRLVGLPGGYENKDWSS